MIVRTVGDHTFVTRQQDHAHQSARISAHLLPEYLGDPHWQQDFLLATRHHDDGWTAWDDAPVYTPEGLPQNFTDVAHGDHHETWARTIFSAAQRISAPAAAAMASHALKILEYQTEDHREHDVALLTTLAARAWPDASPDERDALIQRGYSILKLGDVLSLIPLAGWSKSFDLTLIGHDGQRTFTAKSAGDWKVAIDPWPFTLPELNRIDVKTICIPRGQELHAREILANPREYAVRVGIDYVPG